MNPTVLSWLPASKVGRSNITPVAWFSYKFEDLVSTFGAKPSTDRQGGGAGPVHFFFLRIGVRGLAELGSWEARPGQIELSLVVNQRGIVYWEDFEAVMVHVPVPLEEVHRQGAFHWRRRRPAAEAAPSQ